jgi:phosphoglycolate phosphatase (TIGR01487 family)
MNGEAKVSPFCHRNIHKPELIVAHTRPLKTAEVGFLRYTALAFDYDGTLAKDGAVAPAVVDVLKRIKESGRKLLIVSGRVLSELQTVFEHVDLFDKVVVENGAVIYTPETGETRLLTEGAPEALVEELDRIGAKPAVGDCIVATWTPFETPTLEAIQKLGLDHAVIFNKGAVMVLPSGVNKASGLKAALDELGLSAHNVISVGDAENDHAMLSMCEFGVAVSNALPAVKERADFVTEGDHGDGIIEICERVLASDLMELAPARHRLEIGLAKDTQDTLAVSTFGPRILLCGSALDIISDALLQKLAQQNYQLCVVDPQGAHGMQGQPILLGTKDGAPSIDEISQAIALPDNNLLVNLAALRDGERGEYFEEMLATFAENAAGSGRPHWVAVHDLQVLLPSVEQALVSNAPPSMLMSLSGMHLAHTHPEVLRLADVFIATGESAYELTHAFADLTGRPRPHIRRAELQPGQALVWLVETAEPPVVAELDVAPEHVYTNAANWV